MTTRSTYINLVIKLVLDEIGGFSSLNCKWIRACLRLLLESSGIIQRIMAGIYAADSLLLWVRGLAVSSQRQYWRAQWHLMEVRLMFISNMSPLILRTTLLSECENNTQDFAQQNPLLFLRGNSQGMILKGEFDCQAYPSIYGFCKTFATSLSFFHRIGIILHMEISARNSQYFGPEWPMPIQSPLFP